MLAIVGQALDRHGDHVFTHAEKAADADDSDDLVFREAEVVDFADALAGVIDQLRPDQFIDRPIAEPGKAVAVDAIEERFEAPVCCCSLGCVAVSCAIPGLAAGEMAATLPIGADFNYSYPSSVSRPSSEQHSGDSKFRVHAANTGG